MADKILKCPYCGSKSVKERGVILDYYRCNKCGHSFYAKIPDKKKRYSYFSDAKMTQSINITDDTSIEKIGPGQWLYSVQNRTTREYRNVITDNLDKTLSEWNWEKYNTWALPIKKGVEMKQKEEENTVSKEGEQLQVEEPQTKGLQDMLSLKEKSTKSKPVKKPKGETLKSLIIAVIEMEPTLGKEKVIEQISAILKKAAIEKNGRSDDEHIHKRSNLSYYFYKTNK